MTGDWGHASPESYPLWALWEGLIHLQDGLERVRTPGFHVWLHPLSGCELKTNSPKDY